MKGVMCALLVLALTGVMPAVANTKNCEHHLTQIQRYTDLRRKGGTARQMDTWHKKRNFHKDAHAACKRSAAGPAVQVAANPQRQQLRADAKREMAINTANPILQQLINTCNFWVREHKKSPTKDTLIQRDTACNAADTALANPPPVAPQDILHTRTLAECIKPGDLIDNQVADCMQGKLSPDWHQ